MDLERLLELAGVPLKEDEYGRDQGARAERQGSEFQKTENKALKKKVKDFYNKSAGDEKSVEMAAKKYGISVAYAKELLDESIRAQLTEAPFGDVKNWTAKDFAKALKNEGLMDDPHFGDLKFVTIGNGDKKDGQYLAVVENDEDGTWMITYIYGWFKDSEPRADWSGSPILEGFSSKRYANDALKWVARKAN